MIIILTKRTFITPRSSRTAIIAGNIARFKLKRIVKTLDIRAFII